MSFAKPEQKLEFPDTIDVELKKGHFQFYDKKKKESIQIPLPFRFVPLAERTTIRGFNKPDHKGIYSNEVKQAHEWLHPKVFGSNRALCRPGPWKEIKEAVAAGGGRYTKAVYAVTEAGRLIRLFLSGSPFSCWIEKGFSPEHDQCGVEVKEIGTHQNGTATCYDPKFAKWELSKDMLQTAIDESVKLDKFFEDYEEFKRKKQDDPAKDDAGFDQSWESEDEVNQALQEVDDEVPF